MLRSWGMHMDRTQRLGRRKCCLSRCMALVLKSEICAMRVAAPSYGLAVMIDSAELDWAGMVLIVLDLNS